MKNNLKVIISAGIIAYSLNALAKENEGSPRIKAITTGDNRSIMSGCAPATAQVDLDINNVRTKILNGGDMWWDLIGNARYYIPKPANPGEAGPSSLFAGSLWIGGFDPGGSLKVAAMTYRQNGNDYYPGPLTSLATTDASTCLAWDKFWKLDRTDVATYNTWIINGSPGVNPVSSTVMDVINTWPAFGPEGQPLAPFYDSNGDKFYDPSQGDYPDFDVTGTRGCAAQLYGDQCIWWVFNDKGNLHTETDGLAIGLEIQAQAFAFQTTDEINNMTFYKYKVINKSSFRLDSTYFGVWDDPDLGWAYDDHVGCDVGLGLGIVYNADDLDGSGQITAYGANPPAVGIDFFEGPYADSNGVDEPANSVPPSFLNYGDKIIDNERLGIGKFVYYNNDFTPQGNPQLALHYYQYLCGYWKDAVPFTYGTDAHSGSIICNYVFPGTSDPLGYGTGMNPQPGWTAAGTPPADKRIIESAGPFTLEAGAVNTITIGVPWARATQGGALASVALLKGADAKAQQLFNNCFSTLNGPDAPALAIQELDKELILTWSNPSGSNNFREAYVEDYDNSSGGDSAYRFQGYQIYQLKDGTVGQTELYNIDKSRLVFQCDKEDAVSQIVNYTNDPLLSALVPKEMAGAGDGNGGTSNKGIVHSFKITTDKFATGDNRLINHKTYYYAIIAYGYSPTQIPNDLNQLVNYSPFIAGRRNAQSSEFVRHPAIPHIPSPEAGGTEKHSSYGSGPRLKRIEGKGNGGNILDITDQTAAEIVAGPAYRSLHPLYENARGPINIKVVDPLNVPAGSFSITLFTNPKVTGIIDTAKWQLKNLGTGDTVNSETSIKLPNEQIINGQSKKIGSVTELMPKWGISVNATLGVEPGGSTFFNNGFLDATMTFSDPALNWLTGVADAEGVNQNNWIRSGTFKDPVNLQYEDYSLYNGTDDIQVYEKMIGGTWAPFRLSAYTMAGAGAAFRGGPSWNNALLFTQNKLKNIASVDVVITSDRTKWTRCPVLELQEEAALAVGGVPKLLMRSSLSVDKAGRNSTQAGYNSTEGDLNGTIGMSWFPGYAINLETGERLNMAFGEDSWEKKDNGADMMWNPTTTKFSTAGGNNPVFGGKHYIYIFGHNADQTFASTQPDGMGGELKDVPRYDEGKAMNKLLTAAAATYPGSASDNYRREMFIDAMWVNIPILATGHSLLESTAKIRLRVSKPLQKFGTGTPVSSTDPLTPNAVYYVESGTVTYNGNNYTVGTVFKADIGGSYTVNPSLNTFSSSPTVLTTVNNANPQFEFSTADIETHKNDAATAKDALALINVVPNPYYAYSLYEKEAIENVAKITNLPPKCTVSIYTLSGTLIRKFKVDQSGVATYSSGIAITSLDWDMKNTAGIQVASGLYIIHVDVPEVGERILKWFGVMRPQDLDAY